MQAQINGTYKNLISNELFLCYFSDQGIFYNFVNAIRANGGGDGPEDIMGGLQAAFSRLSWGNKEVCKVSHSLINDYCTICHS